MLQVGLVEYDHASWGRPEDMTMLRPSYAVTNESGGADLLGEAAAALAAGYMVFHDTGARCRCLFEHRQWLTI